MRIALRTVIGDTQRVMEKNARRVRIRSIAREKEKEDMEEVTIFQVPVIIAGNTDIDTVLPTVVHKERLRAALTLVITRTDTNWVHVAPVGLRLRVDGRIAIDF